MSADNFLAIVKEGPRKWVGYHCSASQRQAFNNCFACLGSKEFETTTELKALHEAQRIEEEMYLEYGYSFVRARWLTKKQAKITCPCEEKEFINPEGIE